MNNHYKTLGAKPTASPEEIRQAFRKMALKYHPDRNGSPDAAIRIKEVYEAYGVLRDTASRAEYDTQKYESQRLWARTKAKEDLQASSINEYEKLFATNQEIFKTLNKTLGEMKRELNNTKRDLDEEFTEYGSSAKARQQTLKEEMRRMASEMVP